MSKLVGNDYMRKTRIEQKLAELDTYLNELQLILPNPEDYTKNLVTRRAAEKTLELCIETVLDIANLIVSEENLGFPDDETHAIQLLSTSIIPEELAKQLLRMKGFRNILIHRYAAIQPELVISYLTDHIKDFSEFKQAITKYLQ